MKKPHTYFSRFEKYRNTLFRVLLIKKKTLTFWDIFLSEKLGMYVECCVSVSVKLKENIPEC